MGNIGSETAVRRVLLLGSIGVSALSGAYRMFKIIALYQMIINFGNS